MTCGVSSSRKINRIERHVLHQGFTLLELLVVMTLATLVLAIVPTSFSSMVPHVERKAQIRDLVFALRTARGVAVREGQEVTFTLDLKNYQYSLSGSGEIKNLPKSYTIKYIPQFPPVPDNQLIEIHFFADGSSSGGQIDLAAEDLHYDININWLTGKIDYRENESHGG